MPSFQQDRWYERLRNWLWGYDFFISYHWASGGTYAVNLAVGSSRVDLQACKLEYSIVSPK